MLVELALFLFYFGVISAVGLVESRCEEIGRSFFVMQAIAVGRVEYGWAE